DLKPVTDAITDLAARVDTLASRVDLLSEEVAGSTGTVGSVGDRLDALASGLDGLEGDVEVLTRAALDLQQVVTQPLDLANFEWGALTGVVLQTVPATAEVTIEPGECPEGTDDGYSTLWGNQVIGTTFH